MGEFSMMSKERALYIIQNHQQFSTQLVLQAIVYLGTVGFRR